MKTLFRAAALVSCLGASLPALAYTVEERVVMRSDGRDARPDWVSETMPVQEGDAMIRFVGMTEVPIESRPKMALRAADAQAKAEYAGLVESNLTRIVSITEDGMDIDDIDVTSFVQEASRQSLNNIRVKARYWERVIAVQHDGGEEGVLKAFSLIEIPEKDLKQAVNKAIESADAPSSFKSQMEILVVREWATVF